MRAQQPRHCSNAFDCGTLPVPNKVAAKQLCTELYFPQLSGGRLAKCHFECKLRRVGRGKGLFEGLSTCQL